MFTTDASTFCRFKPMIVLSQDMLSYEPGAMKRYGYTKQRLRVDCNSLYSKLCISIF